VGDDDFDPTDCGDWDLEKSGRLLAGRFQECVSPPRLFLFMLLGLLFFWLMVS